MPSSDSKRTALREYVLVSRRSRSRLVKCTESISIEHEGGWQQFRPAGLKGGAARIGPVRSQVVYIADLSLE